MLVVSSTTSTSSPSASTISVSNTGQTVSSTVPSTTPRTTASTTQVIRTTAPELSTTSRTAFTTLPVPEGCISYGSQNISWLRYPETHGIHGEIKIPGTRDQCLSLCANDPACFGVDVVDMGLNTIECWAHYSQSNIDERQPLQNSILYVKKICEVPTLSPSVTVSLTSPGGCVDSFTENPQTSSPFGVPNGLQTLDECKTFCINTAQCVAIDFDTSPFFDTSPSPNTASCWIHHNISNLIEKRTSSTINQYVIQRCVNVSTPAPEIIGTTPLFTLTRGSSAIFTSQPTGNCLMFEGWGANANAGASVGEKQTRKECADACLQSMTCQAADYDTMSGQCYLHTSATTLRQRNICCYRLEKLCNTQYVCPGSEFYQMYANTRVMETNPTVLTVNSRLDCEARCSDTMDCTSFNWLTTSITNNCELLYSAGVSVISDRAWEAHLRMKCVSTQAPITTPASNAKYTCPNLDIIFIMDGSGSSLPYWETTVLPFFLDVARVLPLDGIVRLGAVKFSSSAGVVMKFNQGTSFTSVSTIWNTPNARDVGGGTTNLGKALQVAAEEISLVEEGDRTFAPNKILLYTDGIDDDLPIHPPSLQDGINSIREKNIDVFILRGGIIDDIFEADNQMRLITGQNSNNNIYKDPGFPRNRLSNFDSFLDSFVRDFLGCSRI